MSGNVRQLAKEAINYVAEQPFVRNVCRRTLNNFQNVFLGNPKFSPDWIKKFLAQNIAYSSPYVPINMFPQNAPVTCLFWKQIQQNLLMARLKHRRFQLLPSSQRRAFAGKTNPSRGDTSIHNQAGRDIKRRAFINWENYGTILKGGLGTITAIAIGTYIICENYTEHELCDKMREKLGLKKK